MSRLKKKNTVLLIINLISDKNKQSTDYRLKEQISNNMSGDDSFVDLLVA